MSRSPYQGKSIERWSGVTQRLLGRFPISMDRLVAIVLESWEDVFQSRIGRHGFRIGEQIVPQPQIMGFLLHELIPLNLHEAFPGDWCRGKASSQCDAHNLLNSAQSFEIKTSSSTTGIFGNRSYAQISAVAVKRRGGYLLAVNFGKFAKSSPRPEVTLIRFGWLDPEDWIGQRAQSGQQAHLTKEARAYKLRVLFERSKQ